MSGWTVAWLLWLLAFAVIEGIAIYRRRYEGTLSRHVWKWFAIKGQGRNVRWRRFIFLAGWAWLTVHFLTGGWV